MQKSELRVQKATDDLGTDRSIYKKNLHMHMQMGMHQFGYPPQGQQNTQPKPGKRTYDAVKTIGDLHTIATLCVKTKQNNPSAGYKTIGQSGKYNFSKASVAVACKLFYLIKSRPLLDFNFTKIEHNTPIDEFVKTMGYTATWRNVANTVSKGAHIFSFPYFSGPF